MEKHISQKALAEALGLSEAAVSQHAARGMPTQSIEAATAWRIENLEPRVRMQAADGSDSYRQARTRRERANAAKAELELAEAAGALVSVDQVRDGLARVFLQLKEALLSMPNRLAPVLAAEADIAAVHQILQSGIEQALRDAITAADAALSRQEATHG